MAKRYEYYVNPSAISLYIVGGWDPNFYWEAQTFTLGTTGTNEYFKATHINIKARIAVAPGKLTVSIKAVDGNGKPTGDDLAIGYTDANSITTGGGGEWRIISFEKPVILIPSTKYALVFRIDTLEDAVYLFGENSDTYAGGKIMHSHDSGSTWDDTLNLDIQFEIWGYKTDKYEYETKRTGNLVLIYGSNRKYAQAFTIGTIGENKQQTINSIKLILGKYGTLTGNFLVDIYATENGKPTGESLSSGSIPSDILTESDEIYEIPMTPLVLYPSTQYTVVMFYPDGDINDFARVWINDAYVHSGGLAWAMYDGTTWEEIENCSFPFEVWSSYEQIYENYVDEIATGLYILGGFADDYWQGQGVIIGTVGANSNFNINRIRIKGKRVGNVGDLQIGIRPDLTSSDYITGRTYADTLTTDSSGEWKTLYVEDYPLFANENYSFVGKLSSPSNSAVYFFGDTGNPYAGGVESYTTDSGSNWTTQSDHDLQFEIWGNILEKLYDGLIPFSLTPSNLSNLQKIYSGLIQISISPSYSKILDKSYNGISQVSLTPSYSYVLDKTYDGQFNLTLLPNSEYSLVSLDFDYNGQINLSLLPSYSSLLEKYYNGQLMFSLLPSYLSEKEIIYSGIIPITILSVGEYSLVDLTFSYNGQVNFIILPSYLSILERTYGGQINLIITPSAIYSLSSAGEFVYFGNMPLEFLSSYYSILENIYSGNVNLILLPNSTYSLISTDREYNGSLLMNFILSSICERIVKKGKRQGKPMPSPFSNINIMRTLGEMRRSSI